MNDLCEKCKSNINDCPSGLGSFIEICDRCNIMSVNKYIEEKRRMEKYTLEFLSDVFSRHAEEADKNNKRLLEQFKEMNPGEIIPDHMNDDFNLPRALASICEEIQKLKTFGTYPGSNAYWVVAENGENVEYPDGFILPCGMTLLEYEEMKKSFPKNVK